MPNKSWDMEVDMIPSSTNTYNLGSSTNKWKLNGYTVNDACAKGVDTSINSESSTNLPTTAAVVTYIKSMSINIDVSGTTMVVGGDITSITVDNNTLVVV